MRSVITLSGTWSLALDCDPCRYNAPPADFPMTMQLPGTTAQQAIGAPNPARETGYLTEKYPFYGQIWLRKTVTLPADALGKPCFLHLERTRMTELWVNGTYIGAEKSLCTPHIYDLTAHTAETVELVLCVKNIGYPTRGGHMTSPDTQTNWIGVTGALRLELHAPVYLSDVQAYPNAAERSVTLRGSLHGAESAAAAICAEYADTCITLSEHQSLTADDTGCFAVTLHLPDSAPLWSEYNPQPIRLTLTLPDGEQTEVRFGLRDFRAADDHFEINENTTMLRGKHDGLIFPLEGAAPTDTETWLRVLRIMKDWGINHYRFHTCCPPEAAFAAADLVGIYMEPELPFWGTVHALDDPECNPEEQAYLVREGLRICKAFGNHPSFCMMSLGNELWGSPERLNEILTILKTADPRPLYTQGSNNFQHMPLQVPQEDFWTGVRLGKGKLLRGSFATCDAPIGRIQTDAPSTDWRYEEMFEHFAQNAAHAGGETELEIQYGTGVKRVKATEQDAFQPTVPVVTHEIGQYAVYPDFSEIPHYTGVLEARNFEIFRERLAAAGMGGQAEDFFRCSGALARDCYKAEIEAAMRSPHIAGFQLLDLQDFSGQGTALVGMLNALLENKGFIQPEQWRGFCGDLVPLAQFESYVWTAGNAHSVILSLRNNRPICYIQTFHIKLTCADNFCCEADTMSVPKCSAGAGYYYVEHIRISLPPSVIGKAELTLTLTLDLGEQITNRYALTVLPPVTPVKKPAAYIAHSFAEALPHLQNGERVLLLPDQILQSVKGFYCTDFWCYPMFRSISESMGKEVPVGTMGLCIDETHPIAKAMFSECYSTPQWYTPVTHADCAVLDAAPAGYRPIVQMIDNFERNHRLGLLFEAQTAGGSLLVCTVRLDETPDDPAMNRLMHAVYTYVDSDLFTPKQTLDADMLAALM